MSGQPAAAPPEVADLLLSPDPGCRSREAGLFLAQLEDGHRKLAKSLAGATPEELSWQSAPGANTAAMVTIHIAIAEVHLTDIGVRRLPESDVKAVLGMGPDGDGMPLDPGAAAPARLAGTTEQDLLALLERARAHSRRWVAELSDEDLDQRFERPARTGGTRLLNVRWTLHHLQEHLFGHLGQVQLVLAACRRQAGAAAG